jgi:signal transduction histidine kinase
MTTEVIGRGYRCDVTGRADREKEQIARELHDVIAHSLSVMTVQAGAVRRLLLPEQEQERQALQAVEVTGREALTEMRRLVAMLRDDDEKVELAPQPSLDRLDILIGAMEERGLEVELEVEGEERELPPGIDLSAYRLLQEALTNVLKTVGPSRARVVVRWSDHDLELEIADEGRRDGIPIAARRSVAGMRERAALVGGTLDTARRDGGGFVVRARLPLDEAA